MNRPPGFIPLISREETREHPTMIQHEQRNHFHLLTGLLSFK